MKWALDGGALHLFDLGESADEVRKGMAAAESEARRLGVTLLFLELFEDDRNLAVIEELGFVLDSTERDVRERRVVQRLSYARLL